MNVGALKSAVYAFAVLAIWCPAQASAGALAEMEQRALSNTQFSAGNGYSGEWGKSLCFTHTVEPDAPVLAFVDLIKITLDQDSEVTLYSYAPPPETELTLIQTGCNVNFDPNGVPNPKSRINKWSGADPATITGRHTSFMVRAGGEDLSSPRSFLAVVYPFAGSGLTVCVNKPGVSAHVTWDWHENPLPEGWTPPQPK